MVSDNHQFFPKLPPQPSLAVSFAGFEDDAMKLFQTIKETSEFGCAKGNRRRSLLSFLLDVHLIRAAEVKKAIEWIMCNIDGPYAADSVGAVAAEAQETDSQGGSFMKYSPQRNAARMPSLNDSLSPSNISKNFR
ncbi:similar to VPS54 [Actinidia rufa]|uniref:Similar to VPS54 n=1 Tax=Actinidia rufa TaxID=165716 RepID=A0A7J0DNS0_9ERIC|nr:similar to VPS54 [Actinidia rufa]